MTLVLPGVLADIAELVGEEAAWKVAAAAGGRTKYVPSPSGLHDGHWLVQAVGAEHARAIAAYFATGVGGGEIKFPAGTRAQVARAIAEGLAAGLSATEIAARAGVDERTVFRHRKRTVGDRRQGDLFQS